MLSNFTMKIHFFARLLTGLAVALGATATVSPSSYAQGTTFFCGTTDGVPATIASTSRGDIPMIRWISDYFSSSYTSEWRCQQVSARFQNFYDNGKLRFIRTGIVKGYPVLCLANNQGGDCDSDAVLVTLQQGIDPQLVLERLLNLRARAAGRAIDLSGNQTIFYHDGEAYVNVEKFLNLGNW